MESNSNVSDNLSKYGIDHVFEEGNQKLIPGIIGEPEKPSENFKFGLESSADNDTSDDKAKLKYFEFGTTGDEVPIGEIETKNEFKFGIPRTFECRRPKQDSLNGFKFGEQDKYWNVNLDHYETLPSTHVEQCKLIKEFLKRHPEVRFSNIWDAHTPKAPNNPEENKSTNTTENDPKPIIPEPILPTVPSSSQHVHSETTLQMSKYAEQANMRDTSLSKYSVGHVFDGKQGKLVPGIIGEPEKMAENFKFGIQNTSKTTEPINFEFGATTNVKSENSAEGFKFGIP